MNKNRTVKIYNNIYKQISRKCEFDKPTKEIYGKIVEKIALSGIKEVENATDDQIIDTIIAFLESTNRKSVFPKKIENNILTCLRQELYPNIRRNNKHSNIPKMYSTEEINNTFITHHGGKKRKTTKKTTKKTVKKTTKKTTKSVRCVAKTKAGKRCKHNTTHGKKCGHHRH